MSLNKTFKNIRPNSFGENVVAVAAYILDLGNPCIKTEPPEVQLLSHV